MLETEFDEEKFKRMFKKEGYEEGVQRGLREGLKEGERKGLREGEQKQKISNCIGLLQEHVSVSIIARAIGISEEQVLQIAKDNNISIKE